MSENGVFDKIVEANASRSDGPDGETKITLDSILKEYDAKKAAAEKHKIEADEKVYEPSAFMKEIETLNKSFLKVDEEEQDDVTGESFDDYDDSDMKIAPSHDELDFVQESEKEESSESEPEDTRKLDIMNAISKHFDDKEEDTQKQEPVSEKEEKALEAGLETEKEEVPVCDPSDKNCAKRLGIDDKALKKAFNDDIFDTKRKKKKEKIKLDEEGESVSFAPISANDEEDGEKEPKKRRRYDENGYRISSVPEFFTAKDEYTKSTDIGIVTKELRTKLLYSCFAMFAVIALLFVSFYSEVAPSIGLPHFSSLEPGKTGIVFLLFDLQVLFFAVILKLNSIAKGAIGLFTGTPAAESVAFVSVAAAAIHTITLAIADPRGDQFAPVCSVACLSVLILSLGDFFKDRSEYISFRIVSSEGEKYSFIDLSASEEKTPDEIGKFVPAGTKVLDIRKAEFAGGFFEKIKKPALSEKSTAVAIYIATGIALVASVAYCIMNKEPAYKAFCCFAAVLLTSLQSCMLITSSLPTFIFSDRASRRKCAFIGNNVCEDFSNISVVSFKDTEVFSPKDIKVTNIRTYGTTRIDNVIVTMAKIFGTIGGPLSSVFKNSIAGIEMTDDNMKMIDVAPDGLWVKIDGANYYVGTSSYMAVNNFDTSADMADETFSRSNGGILYLASSERVLAKFYISYRINPSFEQILRTLFDQGICARIKTLDPCISNDFIRACLRRPESLFSVVKAPYAEDIEKVEEVSDSSMVSSSGENSLIRSFLLVDKMRKVININNKLKFLALGLSLALSAFALLAGSVILPGVVMMLIQIFWLVPVFITAKMASK